MEPDARRKLERSIVGMDLLAALICIGAAVAVLAATMSLIHRPGLSKREAQRRGLAGAHLLGIPKALTFDYQIGKIDPASSAASLEAEARDGFPSSLNRFGEWLGHVAQGDGSLHPDEVEWEWGMKMVEAVVVMGVFFGLFLFGSWVSRQDEMRMDRKDGEAMMEKAT